MAPPEIIGVRVVLLCNPLDWELDGIRAARRSAAVRLDPHKRVFRIPPINFLDDVQHVPVSLAVWVVVIDADHQNQVYLLGAVRVLYVPFIGPHDDVRLRDFLGPVLCFVVSLDNGEILGVDADRPLIACGTCEGLPLEQIRQVRHKGVLQKFRCRRSRLLDFLPLFVLNSLCANSLYKLAIL